MSKHTPGPWAAAARQGSDWDLVVYKPDTSLEICQMFHDFTKGNPIGQANAYLVAAAPELLEDASSTNQGYDWFREQMETFIAYQGSWTLEVGQNWAESIIAHINSRQIGTRAAIAKAEGGAA